MDVLIVAVDRPKWRGSDQALRQALLGRRPDAGLYPTAEDSPGVLTAEVDAPDIDAAADFAAWWASRAPGLEPDVRLYVTADFSRSVRLSRSIDRDAVRAGPCAGVP